MKLDATIIVALGHGNTEATVSDLRSIYAALRRYASPTVDVRLCSFNANWRAMADRIHQDSAAEAQVLFVGHSYGCGWGLRRFARFLDDNGRRVRLACLIDPVIRWFQFLTPLNLISLTRMGSFRLPRNVDAAHVWRQVNARPPGRYVRGDGVVRGRVVFGSRDALRRWARCKEEPVVDATVTHETIDGLMPVQRAILGLLATEMAQGGHRYFGG